MLLNILGRKHIKKLSDPELIVQIKSGQSKLPIGELYNRYGMMLFGVGLKYMKNKMDAEDILMQTFEKLPAKIEKSEIKNLKNWLYTIVKNECLMKLRAKKIPEAEIDKALLFVNDTGNEEIEDVILKEQKLSQLELAINKLKDEQKTCIELFYLKQLCYETIAQTTGYELKKVKSYIQNGKRNLRLILIQNEAFR